MPLMSRVSFGRALGGIGHAETVLGRIEFSLRAEHHWHRGHRLWALTRSRLGSTCRDAVGWRPRIAAPTSSTPVD